MSKIKRLVQSADQLVQILPPITEDELDFRSQKYEELEPKKFNRNFVRQFDREVHFQLEASTFSIQYNHCANPFCRNYGQPQVKFKSKYPRYKLDGSMLDSKIFCNQKDDGETIPSLNCKKRLISNWSVATEIERLYKINKVLPIEDDYDFHRPNCSEESTPFSNTKAFIKKGTSAAKGQRYQCRICRKITTIKPSKRRNTSYNQKRNDVLPMFAEQLTNRVPVTSTCRMLKIGRGTYYNKLEWLYRCCLEFLDTRETKLFQKKSFEEMWVSTDKMAYVLNNVRKKGQSKKNAYLKEEKQLPTQVVVSADGNSRYVFRADVAYDWEITKDQIELDTSIYKDDHLSLHLSKNAKFNKHFSFPMPPTKNDTQSNEDYLKSKIEFEKRFNYVDGLHVNQGYTTTAHLFHLKRMVKSNKWRFVTDNDQSLIGAFHRVFQEEVASKNAYSFTMRVDKTLSPDEAYLDYVDSLKSTKAWGKLKGLKGLDAFELGYQKLLEELQTHDFTLEHVSSSGEIYRSHAKNPITHPIGMKDRGRKTIDCLTDMTHLPTYVLAQFVDHVSDHAVNAFLHEVRRSLSTLERPLVTSRGDGKSYIYSNFNPKYAQMCITILRTHYNFCKPFKTGDEKKGKTPAQRIGIADRSYSWQDIIYKR